jgi:peptide/nickel transport system permease protein
MLAVVVLSVTYVAATGASLLAPYSYERQDREHAGEAPNPLHRLGTDELGRDRLARLLYGARTSLLLAPAATLLATAIAAFVGAIAGCTVGALRGAILYAVDAVSGTPWFLGLLLVRALLPLNVGPGMSLAITFFLLGVLGWPQAVRLIAARTGSALRSTFYLQARACGVRPLRLATIHVAASLKPILTAHFWSTMPVFILAEANLSVLGLGVAEPLPSLGNLVSELRDCEVALARPWLLAPAVAIVVLVGALQVVSRGLNRSYDCV